MLVFTVWYANEYLNWHLCYKLKQIYNNFTFHLKYISTTIADKFIVLLSYVLYRILMVLENKLPFNYVITIQLWCMVLR